tara:strand:+ start:211 stop:387 length:177 start_codon:yes stop_codon:yes gene_type:complete
MANKIKLVTIKAKTYMTPSKFKKGKKISYSQRLKEIKREKALSSMKKIVKSKQKKKKK